MEVKLCGGPGNRSKTVEFLQVPRIQTEQGLRNLEERSVGQKGSFWMNDDPKPFYVEGSRVLGNYLLLYIVLTVLYLSIFQKKPESPSFLLCHFWHSGHKTPSFHLGWCLNFSHNPESQRKMGGWGGGQRG